VWHRFIYTPAGPWAIHVLDVNLSHCYSAIALKSASGAIGREKTSTMLQTLATTRDVIGGVNADFFLFTPPGVPTGAYITGSRVVAGPIERPVLAIDQQGHPLITELRAAGTLTIGQRRLLITGWNRTTPRGLSYFDASWSSATDTATAAVEVVLSETNPTRVVLVDTLTSGVAIPRGGGVIVGARNAPDSLRAALLALRPGESVRTSMLLTPVHPREAVGGRPTLTRDSVIVGATIDSVGASLATTRHPRTAVGIANSGRRLFLVVVDGRQPSYSVGMSLLELANLMLALGARDAINLDGGGSTTFVVADPNSTGRFRVANRPSDAQGERPVANALAIVAGCPGR
jgi:hypothetical protein